MQRLQPCSEGRSTPNLQPCPKEPELRRISKRYWNIEFKGNLPDQLRWYITKEHKELNNRSLLEAEIECAQHKGNIQVQSCENLVLLVGFSLEPLLQLIYVYQPKTVILILNQNGYAGEPAHIFASHLVEAVDYLYERGTLSSKPIFLGEKGRAGYPVPDSPEKVFRCLVGILHDKSDVVIDVTGGKKSMVSGAYLYAAYSGARISYVDFDEFDPNHRRPYGYSCKIGELANPYETFALREWELVRTLYNRWQFREARLLLEGGGKELSREPIINSMQKYLPDSIPSVRLLAKILYCYELWDAGMYNEAAKAVTEIQEDLPEFTPPTGVTHLGGKWFEPKQGRFEGGLANFYEDTPEFRAYVLDELARIRRLIDNERYRAAFLRAASLNETIMLARLVRLVSNENERRNLLEALQHDTPGARSVFENLTKPIGTRITVGRNKFKCDIGFRGAPEIELEISMSMEWLEDLSLLDSRGREGWDKLINRRNEITHKHYSPPRDWAEDALRFVRANISDFYGDPIDNLMAQHKLPLSWSELCSRTGIDQYLPPNLRQEA